ncbi:MAG TPA: hypothetical protein VIX82_17140 [Solirubrobacteraceae bacterium]
MSRATSNMPASADTHLTFRCDPDDDSRELRRYRRICREIDRLLDQGRLFDALRLNDEARALFRTLFSAGQFG